MVLLVPPHIQNQCQRSPVLEWGPPVGNFQVRDQNASTSKLCTRSITPNGHRCGTVPHHVISWPTPPVTWQSSLVLCMASGQSAPQQRSHKQQQLGGKQDSGIFST